MKFYIVDAFSNKVFGGNTAGVVLLDDKADFPSDEIMTKIACELRYSETAFVKRISEDTFKTRYFTPVKEVDLCGHATIASFHVLLKNGEINEGEYYNETNAGKLKIEVKNDMILMEMGKPEVIKKFDEEKDIDDIREIYDALNLDFDKVKNPYFTFMPQIVTTGLPEIFVSIFNLDALNDIKPNFEKIKEVSKKHNCIGIHAYTLMAPDMKVHARNFAPIVGVDEESATGTSNGALAHLLLTIDMAIPETMSEVVQGEKMGKPSIINVINTKKDGEDIVKVGGSAAIFAEGEIII